MELKTPLRCISRAFHIRVDLDHRVLGQKRHQAKRADHTVAAAIDMRRNRHSAVMKHQRTHCLYRQVSRIDEQLFQRTDRLIFFPYDPLISKQRRLVPYVRQVSVNFFPCAERRLQRRKIPQNMYVLFAGNFHSGQHGDPVFLPGGDCLRQIQCGVVIGQRNRVQAQHFRHPHQIPWGHFIIPAGRHRRATGSCECAGRRKSPFQFTGGAIPA